MNLELLRVRDLSESRACSCILSLFRLARKLETTRKSCLMNEGVVTSVVVDFFAKIVQIDQG